MPGQQDYDLFQDDSFSLGNFQDNDLKLMGEEAPFKVNLNFIKEDSLSNNEPTPFSKKANTNQLGSEIQKIGSEPVKDFSKDQIYKINNVHEKLKILVLFEHQNCNFRNHFLNKQILENQKLIKSKQLSQESLQQVIDKYGSQLEKGLNPIKMHRIGCIPKEKRVYYLNKQDKQQIQKKKIIKALIFEKNREFLIKKGLYKQTDHLKKYRNHCKLIEERIALAAGSLQEQRIKPIMTKILQSSSEQSSARIAKSVQIFLEQMQKIRRHQISEIQQSMLARQQVIDCKLYKYILEVKANTVTDSEDLTELVDAKGLFDLLPDIGSLDLEDFYYQNGPFSARSVLKRAN